MARYEYRCEKCGETFVVEERISNHSSDASPECPECGGRETCQELSEFFPDTSDKT